MNYCCKVTEDPQPEPEPESEPESEPEAEPESEPGTQLSNYLIFPFNNNRKW